MKTFIKLLINNGCARVLTVKDLKESFANYIENATVSDNTVGYYSFTHGAWRQRPRHCVQRTLSVVKSVTTSKEALT